MTFNAPVDALNRPAVSLWVDGTGESVWKPARYKSGTGTKTLRFAREVAPADRDADGLTIGAVDSDGLGEGKVRAAGTDIDAVHSYRAQRNLSGHRVDAWPYVTDRQLTSAPAQGGTYRKGETIAVTVTFDQEVDVKGEVTLELRVQEYQDLVQNNPASPWRYAAYASGSGSDAIVFEYVVQRTDLDRGGVGISSVASSGFRGSGTIKAAGTDVEIGYVYLYLGSQQEHKIDGRLAPAATPTPTPTATPTPTPTAAPTAEPSADETAPTVSSVAFTSNPGDDGAYGIGDRIDVTATFSEDVAVTGTPQLTLDIGSSEENASYESVTGAAALFAYTVEEGDADADGIAIGADALSLNGGSITDAAGNAAVLTHVAVDDDDGHTVDGVRPTFTSAAVSEDGTQVVVTFSEALTPPSLLQWLSDTLNLPLGLFYRAVVDVTIGGEEVEMSDASLSGTNLTLTLADNRAIFPGRKMQVAYDNIFAADAVGLFMDDAGNALENFSAQGSRTAPGCQTSPLGRKLALRSQA